MLTSIMTFHGTDYYLIVQLSENVVLKVSIPAHREEDIINHFKTILKV